MDWTEWSGQVNRRISRIERWVNLREAPDGEKTLGEISGQAIREYVQRELSRARDHARVEPLREVPRVRVKAGSAPWP